MNDGSPDNISDVTVTCLLNQVSAGNPQAAAELLPLVYQQLRAMAARNMREERSDHSLQATALVHEAYLRMVDPTGARQWDGRWHFLAAAAEAMRRILVDHARSRARLKRGGGVKRVNLEDQALTVNEPPQDLLALDEALTEFTNRHPDKAQFVKLRYFAGLTMDEAARAMDFSPRTAGRVWAYSRAWLYARINATGNPHE